MRTTSQEYRDYVLSPIRNVTEPQISIYGTDQSMLASWSASTILGMEIHMVSDPVGRDVPLFEVSWTERVEDMLGELPARYASIPQYSMVRVIINERVRMVNTWDDVLTAQSAERTWGAWVDSGSRWMDVYHGGGPERASFNFFGVLAELPTLANNVLTWRAVGVFQVLDIPTSGEVYGSTVTTISGVIASEKAAAQARFPSGSYIAELIGGISVSGLETIQWPGIYGTTKPEGTVAEAIRDYAASRNMYYDASGWQSYTTMAIDKGPGSYVPFFSLLVQFSYPKVEWCDDVSSCEVKMAWFDTADGEQKQTVWSWNVRADGSAYTEDNPCFVPPYLPDPADVEAIITARKDAIVAYFGADHPAIEVECLPHFAITPGDIVDIEVTVPAAGATKGRVMRSKVVDVQFTLNGAWRMKMKAHVLDANYEEVIAS